MKKAKKKIGVTKKHRPVVYKTKTGFKKSKKSRFFPHEQVTLTGEKGMAGLPKKYAKMGFAKGWAMYRREHGGRKSISGSKHTKGKRKGIHHALWLDGDFTAPAIVRNPVKRLQSITPGKIVSPIIDLVLIIAGMAVGAGIKKASPIKNVHLMNGTQAVIGIGGSLMTKNRFVKMPLIGVALQSAISEAKTFFPNVPLAGDDEVVYLPVGEDGQPQQIEVQGDDRVGNDDRISADDEEVVAGEGSDE